MNENLVYKSDDEIETLKQLDLLKKEKFNLIWEIDGECFILHHADADGYYFGKIKKKQ